MQVLIVYGSQYGTTHKLARAIGGALEPDHDVRILAANEAKAITGDGIDLLFVGAPTQMRGLRLLVRAFTDGLERRGYAGVSAAAFDTRMGEDTDRTLECDVIAGHLTAAGCRMIVVPESFLVSGVEGPLAPGESERAATWARSVADAVAIRT